jgi:hypothetical protein
VCEGARLGVGERERVRERDGVWLRVRDAVPLRDRVPRRLADGDVASDAGSLPVAVLDGVIVDVIVVGPGVIVGEKVEVRALESVGVVKQPEYCALLQSPGCTAPPTQQLQQRDPPPPSVGHVEQSNAPCALAPCRHSAASSSAIDATAARAMIGKRRGKQTGCGAWPDGCVEAPPQGANARDSAPKRTGAAAVTSSRRVVKRRCLPALPARYIFAVSPIRRGS